MQPSDGTFWAALAAILGAIGGAFIRPILTFLRLQQKGEASERAQDRRSLDKATGRLIDHLERRVKKTEEAAQFASERLAQCELDHAECRASVAMLTGRLNELLAQARMEPIALQRPEKDG